MKYKIIDDLTSDVMFEAYGRSLEELFSNSGVALFSIICQIDEIKPVESVNITVEGASLQELLFNWLQQILVTAEINELFLCDFKIVSISENKVEAIAFGEPISRGKGGTLVKAVTNYKFGVERNAGNFVARVTLDI